ncbi:MAG TPA: alkaline phosphatase family protein [Streptosporangiaceae bacterium]
MRVRLFRRGAAAASAAGLLLGGALLATTGLTSAAAASQASTAHHRGSGIRHVLLISVDGLHQQDLTWYVHAHPGSVLAALERHGLEYASASTPFPSDSFPGMVGQVTGGDPGVTGIYYDDTWNHDVFPAGTTACTGPVPGGEVAYTEADDLNLNRLDAGQGVPGLPGSILRMTSHPLTVINPANLPVNPKTCKPILPGQYLKVNTIFNVAAAHGLLTAWSDKHPAYEALSGPSGQGVTDFFTPEINSVALGFPAGNDWTTDNAATMQYDSYKVQAVLNWIDGFNHSRTRKAGVPAIFGMNFQTVSTAEKLPVSDGLTGGYLPGGTVPGPLLRRALNFVDAKIGAMVAEIRARGLASSTAIIISAKHGQSPTNPNDLARVDDGPVISGIDAAWTAVHPKAPALVAFATDDDGMLLWLSNRSQSAADFVRHYLLTHTAAGNNVKDQPVTVQSSGLKRVYAGAASAAFFGVPAGDPRHPDITGIAQHGVVYTGGTKKIAEHGGDDPQDRHVPILVVLPGLRHGQVSSAPVETTQIAPTILTLLGLPARDLKAVRIEHTRVLPGIGGGGRH